MHHMSPGYRIYLAFNYLILTILALMCLFPIINVLAVSFSSSSAAGTGEVVLWPVEFTVESYSFVLQNNQFISSFWVSFQRVVLGVGLNILITVLVAYPLSKEPHVFRFRTFYVWLFVFTMLFNGGLIPTFLVVKELGLMNSIWSLVLPVGVQVFNIVLMLNFFRGLPKELEEASLIDGAGHMRTLWSIFLPISLPSLATITLFSIVMHWNAWLDGRIYMNSTLNYPLATYLQDLLSKTSLPKTNLSLEELRLLENVSSRTVQAAQIFITALPVLIVYPFLQKYFTKGLVLGSVKG